MVDHFEPVRSQNQQLLNSPRPVSKWCCASRYPLKEKTCASCAHPARDGPYRAAAFMQADTARDCSTRIAAWKRYHRSCDERFDERKLLIIRMSESGNPIP